MASKFRLLIQNEAIEEMDRLYQLACFDKPMAAKKFIQGLKKTIFDLKRFPKRGTLCRLKIPLPNTEIRFISYKGYLIFYQIKGNVVTVLHLLGPGRDWMKLYF